MNKRQTLRALLASVLAAAMYPSTGFAQEKSEGTVVRTELTLCDFKPGGCEGSLVLETKSAGKLEQMTIKVPKGTLIKKSNDFVLLPALRGSVVSVSYVKDKGDNLAKSIEVLQSKK